MPFLITILALGFVIFIHELGHLLAAKRAKVGVSEFAVGMGPKLFSFNYGGTMYALRALPFGGFIKAKGFLDDGEECAIEEDYRQKSVFDRVTIISAGSVMNLLLGFVIFFISALVVGNVELTSTVQKVLPNYPAEASGLLPGDQIIKVNDTPVINIQEDIIKFIQTSDAVPFQLTFIRNGVSQTVTTSAKEVDNGPSIIGVEFESKTDPAKFFTAFGKAVNQTGVTIGQSVAGLGMLLTGKANIKELAGPVGIVQIASSQVQQNMMKFLNIMAFISISLGVINMLPFPVLDGGHLTFLIIEAFRGKPLSKKVEVFVNNTAAAMLIGLMIFIVFNDVISWNERVNIIQEMNQ